MKEKLVPIIDLFDGNKELAKGFVVTVFGWNPKKPKEFEQQLEKDIYELTYDENWYDAVLRDGNVGSFTPEERYISFYHTVKRDIEKELEEKNEI